ncbi:hypothetical protein DMA11_14495 [Marinilabiliaceae bacterium JC017]|nr:hypothetical protein DMA11_14495 [Marinilabiliaceae bacterium JC017]
MRPFHTIHYNYLKLHEYPVLVKKCVAVLVESSLYTEELKVFSNQLQQAADELNKGLHPTSTKLETKDVKHQNVQLNAALKGFRHYCKAYFYSTEPAIRQSALLLLEKIRSYGWRIEGLSYNIKSSRVRHLLQDITTSEQSIQAIELLGAQKFVDAIQLAHQGFKQAIENRGEVLSSRPKSNNQTAAAAVRNALQQTFKYLAVMQAITPSPEYHQLVKHLNVVIDECMQPLLIRRGRMQAAKEVEVEQNTEVG